MNCKECQELILSDYIDGELSEKDIAAVEAHLNACAVCRVLAERAKTEFAGLSEQLKPVEPPASVWHNIKMEIEAGSQEAYEPPRSNFIKRLSRLRPVVVALRVAIVTFVIIIGFMKLTVPRNAQIKELTEEASYIARIMEAETPEEKSNGYGTAIEEYFL